MTAFMRITGLAAFTLLSMLFAGQASAQATRTWVSGVGDDANPCSRTAPCKTFAGAISKTAAGGEISVLDPGGFGAVTITKSITINGEGTLAGILSSGTNGIIINATATDVITIREISINCGSNTSPGLDGIRILAAGAVHVENTTIRGCGESGIDVQTASPTTTLYVTNTDITNIKSTPTGDAGIAIRPGVGAKANAVIVDSRINGNKIGVRAEARSNVVIRGSSISGNSNNGVAVISSTDTAEVSIEDSSINFNGVGGISTAGIKLVGGPTLVQLSNNVITGNDVGLLTSGGGQIVSFGNNKNLGNNVSDGVPTMQAPQQ